ncbi:MAG: EcsC family protein [Planctomycetales bacterium]|nr:EcsC family protein [Planctomycetales bacterium]
MNEQEYNHSDMNPEGEPTSTSDADSVADVKAEPTTKRVAAFEKLVDWFIEFDPFEVKLYVEDQRERYPDLTDDELANRIIGIKSVKNGFVGAATGVPGFLAMPITVPTDLLMSWKIQINLALCIAYVYGHDIDNKSRDEIKTDIYMILAGRDAKNYLKVLGIEIDQVTKASLKRYASRELLAGIWKQIGRHIAVTTGRKSATKLSRMIPLIGAPIGFAFDYTATRTVGAFAREYYRGGKGELTVEATSS